MKSYHVIALANLRLSQSLAFGSGVFDRLIRKLEGAGLKIDVVLACNTSGLATRN